MHASIAREKRTSIPYSWPRLLANIDNQRVGNARSNESNVLFLSVRISSSMIALSCCFSRTDATNPAPSIALMTFVMVSGGASWFRLNRPRCNGRFTVSSATPSTACATRSTEATHAAQLMPAMFRGIGLDTASRPQLQQDPGSQSTMFQSPESMVRHPHPQVHIQPI